MPALVIYYIISPGVQVRKSAQVGARGASQLGRMCKTGGAQKVACGSGVCATGWGRCCTSRCVRGVVRVRKGDSAWCAQELPQVVKGRWLCVRAGVSQGKCVEVQCGSVRVGRGLSWSGRVLGVCGTCCSLGMVRRSTKGAMGVRESMQDCGIGWEGYKGVQKGVTCKGEYVKVQHELGCMWGQKG